MAPLTVSRPTDRPTYLGASGFWLGERTEGGGHGEGELVELVAAFEAKHHLIPEAFLEEDSSRLKILRKEGKLGDCIDRQGVIPCRHDQQVWFEVLEVREGLVNQGRAPLLSRRATGHAHVLRVPHTDALSLHVWVGVTPRRRRTMGGGLPDPPRRRKGEGLT